MGLSSREEGLFARPSGYAAMRKHVLPLLRTYPSVRIWLAGCSSGRQAYELAVLLKEESLYERTRIYATDLSELVLAQGRSGRYPVVSAQESSMNYALAGGTASLADYATLDGDEVVFDPALRENLLFAQHNLPTDGPFNEFHAIVCHQVLTSFNGQLQARVQNLFRESLIRLGFLCLGRDDALICPPSGAAYDTVDASEKIYRRVR
jgi:chemotaxis protein methyltransferase CheR